MRSFLHQDGDYVIYLVQFLTKDHKGKPEWAYAGEGVGLRNVPDELRWVNGSPYKGKGLSPSNDFSASGECWQRLGVHGVFDPDVGMAFVAQLTQYNPGTLYRLVKMTISQKTEVYVPQNKGVTACP